MSQAMLVDTSRIVPAMRPTMGSFSPSAAMRTTLTTKADEMGLESLIPCEMPFTTANTNTSATAKARKPTGCPSTKCPVRTTPAPQKAIQATSRAVFTRFHSACGGGASPRRRRAAASLRTSAMSRMAAPMMSPSAMRKAILRKGSPSCSQPMETKCGTSAQKSSPEVMAGMPMRAPTMRPTPRVEVESSIAPRKATLPAAIPPAMPAAIPPPSFATDWRSSTGSVSARRMLATANPEG